MMIRAKYYWQVDMLLTKGCSPNTPIPSSVLNVVSLKLIPSSVSKSFSWSMVCGYVCMYEQGCACMSRDVHVWAGMGMCILVCIHVCVCVPNKNHAWSSIHTIFCLTLIQVILKWTIYQGMHCLPSDLMNALASKSSPVKRCIICWTVSWIKYAKVCTIYSTTWAHLSKHVFILFNDCHPPPPKLFDNTKKNYCKVSFCG